MPSFDAPAQPPPTTTQPIPPTAVLPPGATTEPAYPLAEKIIGGVVTATPNALSFAQVDPWLIGWSAVINVFLEKLKREKWFPETITPYVMIALGLGIGYLIYYILSNQQEPLNMALGKGAWIVTQSHANWVGGKRFGAFSPTSTDERFHGGHHG